MFGSITFMTMKTTILLALALVLLSGSQGKTLSFSFQDLYATERSESVPSSESEEHALIVSARAIRPFEQAHGSKHCPPLINTSAFRKVPSRLTSHLKASLHILFRVLRH